MQRLNRSANATRIPNGQASMMIPVTVEKDTNSPAFTNPRHTSTTGKRVVLTTGTRLRVVLVLRGASEFHGTFVSTDATCSDRGVRRFDRLRHGAIGRRLLVQSSP